MSGLSDNLKGAANKLKGDVKEGIGNATNDPKLQSEGKLDQLKGEAQQKLGEVKESVSTKIDEISNKDK